MQTVAENWRPIPRFPNYEASDHGNVRSVDRVESVKFKQGVVTRRRRGRVMKQIAHHKGYLVINVSVGGKPTLIGVHQLVADAFHGPANGLTVNHINGNKHDNLPTNLEYMTNRENMLHGYREGLIKNHGEHNGSSKLTEAEVIEIRKLQGRDRPRNIAERFGITPEHVHCIWNRQVWSHVP